jgi:hypothetical protein
MNGVMEMVSEVRRTLILCTRSAFVAAPISSGGQRWSAVDSTYFLQTDFWNGMISECEYPGPIAIWPRGNADMPSHRDKSYRGRVATG